MITLDVAGELYTNFTSAEVTTSMDELSRSFGFGATSATTNPLPFLKGQKCKVFVDGELVLSGNIELINVSGSAGDHTIDVQGRDFTGDLLDSSISIPDFTATVSLKTICETVLKNIGLDIEVIDDLNLKPFVAGQEQVTSEIGDNAFSYLEKYARKREVLLSSDPEGNLLFRQPEPPIDTDKSVFLRHRPDDNQNNVISYEASYDDTGRFNRYIVISQLNPILAEAQRTNKNIVNQTSNTEVDSGVRLGRQLILKAETAGAAGENTTRAKWEANVRKVRGNTYSCVTETFRDQNGKLWEAGDLVFVDDPFAGISANMRINSVIFSTGSEGSTATLTLLEPNAYTLSLEEPVTEKVGVGLVEPSKEPSKSQEELLKIAGIGQ